MRRGFDVVVRFVVHIGPEVDDMGSVDAAISNAIYEAHHKAKNDEQGLIQSFLDGFTWKREQANHKRRSKI